VLIASIAQFVVEISVGIELAVVDGKCAVMSVGGDGTVLRS